MSRLKTRLDKLDGGAPRGFDIPISFYSKEAAAEWLVNVGDFATSQIGVFYRNEDESVEAFLQRVHEESGPPRSLKQMTEDELDWALKSRNELYANAKPAIREEIREANQAFGNMPEYKIKWEDEE